ncbi:MAG: small, acid-soluble spore protein, alpha/beta type [Bacillota bacterium]
MPNENRDLLVPQSGQALENLKLEVANEVGVAQKAGVTGGLTGQSYEQVLDRYKWEVASELGIQNEINRRGWADMPSKLCGQVGGRVGGAIGGQMVKRMITLAEQQLGRDRPG